MWALKPDTRVQSQLGGFWLFDLGISAFAFIELRRYRSSRRGWGWNWKEQVTRGAWHSPMVRHRHRPRFTFLKYQALPPGFTHMNMNQHWSHVYYQHSDTIYSKIYLKCILARWQAHEKLKHHMKLFNYFLCSTKNGTDPEPFYMQKKVHSSRAIDAWAMGAQPSHGWEALLSSKTFHNSSCH